MKNLIGGVVAISSIHAATFCCAYSSYSSPTKHLTPKNLSASLAEKSASLKRRDLLARVLGTSFSSFGVVTSSPQVSLASPTSFENRDRNNNKNALVRDDYWFLLGKTPPRLLVEGQVRPDDPQYNAWGLCSTTGGQNSCTYVPLRQRYEGYSKYFTSVALGMKDFEKVGPVLDQISKNGEEGDNDGLWFEALLLLDPGKPGKPPSAAVDALLKSVLLGNALLVSPNYGQLQREVLIMKFYVNEAAYAISEIRKAIDSKDVKMAKSAWEFGMDSWNSYVVVVNRGISAKVGEPFASLSG